MMKNIKKKRTAEDYEGVFTALTDKCLLEPDFTGGVT